MIRVFIALILSACLASVAQAQKLNGAGATSPFPIDEKWFNEYGAAHPGVEIRYCSIGLAQAYARSLRPLSTVAPPTRR